MNKIINVIAYERVSSEKQVDNYSLGYQRDVIENFAKMNGWKVVKHFREEGRSGRNTNRPAYHEMMQYIKSHKVEAVLVHHLDRLHRNELNTFNDLKYFRDKNIRFIAIADGIDSDDESMSLVTAVKAALSADFSRNLSKRTHMGLKSGAESCKNMGGVPPYGFAVNKVTGTLEIDETTAPAVRMMFELYADGYTTSEICSWLSEHGYFTRNGKSFKPNSLNSIFHNEKYRGCFTWDKAVPKDEEGHRNSHKEKEEYLKIEGGCPAIVSDEIFRKVQERLKENSIKASNNRPKRYYPLNGHIFCECGEKMSGNVQYSNGKPYYQYRCSGRCGNRAVRAEHLEKCVLTVISECLFSSPNTERIITILNNTAKDHRLDTDKEYQQLKSKQHGLMTAQENLLDAVGSGKATTVLLNRLDRINQQLIQVDNRINNLDREIHNFDDNDISEMKENLASYLIEVGNIDNKRFLDSIIQRIDVMSSEIQITLADEISVDKQIKNLFNKKEKNIMGKCRKIEGIILTINGKTDNTFELEIRTRAGCELNYNGNLKINISKSTLDKFIIDSEIDFFDLVGSKVIISTSIDDDENITGILDIEITY